MRIQNKTFNFLQTTPQPPRERLGANAVRNQGHGVAFVILAEGALKVTGYDDEVPSQNML